jgi:hypothetical protein
MSRKWGRRDYHAPGEAGAKCSGLFHVDLPLIVSANQLTDTSFNPTAKNLRLFND